MNKEVLLASSSKYKKQLLKQLAIAFQTIDSLFDEDSFDKNSYSLDSLSQKLAYLKGEELNKLYPDSIIISADQVCHDKSVILSKSGSRPKAIESLMYLSGKTHFLSTSFCIFHQDKIFEDTIIAKMKMKKLTQEQIEKYVEMDHPYDCAGSYKLESFGISLFEKIEVSDHTSIIGLPLISLSNSLQKLGVFSFESLK